MTSEQTWEGKSMLVFYLDLITGKKREIIKRDNQII